MEDYKQAQDIKDSIIEIHYSTSENNVEKYEAEYFTLLRSINYLLTRNEYLKAVYLCSELYLMIEDKKIDSIIETDYISLVVLALDLISKDKILVLGEYGFKILTYIIISTKNNMNQFNIGDLISDLQTIGEFLYENFNKSIFDAFLQLITYINFENYEEKSKCILDLLLSIESSISPAKILTYINSLLNQNIDLSSQIDKIDNFILHLLDNDTCNEEILIVLTNFSFTYFMESYKNEKFIVFMKKSLMIYTKEIINFLHNVLVNDENLIIYYDISYYDLYNIINEHLYDSSIEYIFAFMNCYFKNMTTIITYEIFSNLVTLFQENEDRMIWKTKLLFSVHLSDIITRDITYVQNLTLDMRDFLKNALIWMGEYSEMYARKVSCIFKNIIELEIEISDVSSLENFIENL